MSSVLPTNVEPTVFQLTSFIVIQNEADFSHEALQFWATTTSAY